MNSAPKFNETQASDNYYLISGSVSPQFKPIPAFCAYSGDADEKWPMTLPDIDGEGPDQKVKVKVELGRGEEFISFNAYERELALKDHEVENGTNKVFYIVITLSNELGLSTQYGMTIIYSCEIADSSTSYHEPYVYRWDSNPPVPLIDSIDQLGLVRIKFNTTMAKDAATDQTLLATAHHRSLSQVEKKEEGIVTGRRVANF